MPESVPLKNAKIDVLIPARDEAEALPVLVGEIDYPGLRQILVVDNASSDGTARVAASLGCRTVSCPRIGYGSACLAGLADLAEDPPDIVVFLDGDRSDDPRFMERLLAPILAGTADFVIGSRTLGTTEKGALNLTQRFGNALATRLMALFWGTTYTDLGPFRAIRWSALSRLGMCDTNFGWTIEMQIKAHLHGLATQEVAVDYRNRIGISKISGTLSGCFRAGYKILYLIFKYRWLTLIYGPTGGRDTSPKAVGKFPETGSE